MRPRRRRAVHYIMHTVVDHLFSALSIGSYSVSYVSGAVQCRIKLHYSFFEFQECISHYATFFCRRTRLVMTLLLNMRTRILLANTRDIDYSAVRILPVIDDTAATTTGCTFAVKVLRRTDTQLRNGVSNTSTKIIQIQTTLILIVPFSSPSHDSHIPAPGRPPPAIIMTATATTIAIPAPAPAPAVYRFSRIRQAHVYGDRFSRHQRSRHNRADLLHVRCLITRQSCVRRVAPTYARQLKGCLASDEESAQSPSSRLYHSAAAAAADVVGVSRN